MRPTQLTPFKQTLPDLESRPTYTISIYLSIDININININQT